MPRRRLQSCELRGLLRRGLCPHRGAAIGSSKASKASKARNRLTGKGRLVESLPALCFGLDRLLTGLADAKRALVGSTGDPRDHLLPLRSLKIDHSCLPHLGTTTVGKWVMIATRCCPVARKICRRDKGAQQKWGHDSNSQGLGLSCVGRKSEGYAGSRPCINRAEREAP